MIDIGRISVIFRFLLFHRLPPLVAEVNLGEGARFLPLRGRNTDDEDRLDPVSLPV